MSNVYISRSELEKAYTEMTVKDAMATLNIRTASVFYKLLDEAGIPRKDPLKVFEGKNKYELTS